MIILGKKKQFKKQKNFIYNIKFSNGFMSEAERLDRLLQFIVQEELRKLLILTKTTQLWNWRHHYLLYMKNNQLSTSRQK